MTAQPVGPDRSRPNLALVGSGYRGDLSDVMTCRHQTANTVTDSRRSDYPKTVYQCVGCGWLHYASVVDGHIAYQPAPLR